MPRRKHVLGVVVKKHKPAKGGIMQNSKEQCKCELCALCCLLCLLGWLLCCLLFCCHGNRVSVYTKEYNDVDQKLLTNKSYTPFSYL
jgi:hypothetical protein